MNRRIIEPEEIADEGEREAYRKLIEVEIRHSNSNLIRFICGEFDAGGIIGYYNLHRRFSEKQLKFINGIYERIKRYMDVNKLYEEQGCRNELVALLEEIAANAKPETASGRGEVIENSGNYDTNSPEFSNGQFLKNGNTINRIVHNRFMGRIGELRNGEMVYGGYLKGSEHIINYIDEEKREGYLAELKRAGESFWEIYGKLKEKEDGKNS